MKVVIQRVKSSSVTVEQKIIGEIGIGLNLLVCMEKGDGATEIKKAATKICALRIFSDENGRMNKSVKDIDGEILSISQFTLSWDGQKGNRPSFDDSMEPDKAHKLFLDFVGLLKNEYQESKIKTGEFGASMEVAIVNDGPVTFSLSF
ncbi:MAG: D-aminoacyl-tRNA deacylase [Bdellovibrionota bacterium]|nr:D-aminoacyl-tRNA deacylase [Bdellovibrionota bacterium]